MRFERLQISKFGHFEDLQLEFPKAQGLVVIKGPNEAGKTTLLEALRYLLFGIPAQNAFDFQFPYRAMRLGAHLRDADGRLLEVTRRKAKKADLSDSLDGQRSLGASSQAIDHALLSSYFAGVNAELFSDVFGFSLIDLQEGAAALLASGAGELLAGSVMGGGGTRVRGWLAELKARSEALYRQRGKNQKINHAMGVLKAGAEAVKAKILDPAHYRELEERHTETKAQFEELKAEVDALRKELNRVELLERAYSDSVALGAATDSLGALGEPVSLTKKGADRLLRLLASSGLLSARAAQAEREASRFREEAEQHTVDEALLGREAETEDLAERLKLVASRRDDLRRLEPQIKQAREEILEKLDAVDLSGGLQALRDRALPLGRRAELKRLHEELRSARTRLSEKRELRDDLQRETERLSAEASEGQERIPAELQKLNDALSEMQATYDALRGLEEEREALQAELPAKRANLQLLPPEPADGSRLRLPVKDEVEEWVRRDKELEREALEAQRRAQASFDTVAATTEERAALVESTGVPLPEQLTEARQRRGSGWALVRRSLEGSSPPSAEELIAFAGELELADAYEAAAREADAVVDLMRDKASELARLSEVDVRLRKEGKALELQEARRAEAADALEAARAAWSQAWAEVGVVPGRDRALAWVARLTEVQELRGALEGVERRLAKQRSAWEEEERRLREVLEDPDGRPVALFAKLKRRYEDARRAEVKREEADKYFAQAKRKLAAAQRQVTKLEASAAQLASEIAELLPALGLDPSLEPGLAEERLAVLSDLKAKAEALRKDEATLRVARDAVADYERDVEALLTRLGRARGERSLDQAVRWLSGELKKARAAAKLRLQAQSNAKLKEGEVADTQAVAQREQLELQELCEAAELPVDAALEEAAERALKQATLRDEIAACERRLAGQLGEGAARRALEDALASASPEALSADAKRLAAEIELKERERDDRGAAMGGVEKELEQLGGSDAVVVQAELEEVRADLGEWVDDYVRLRLQLTLLERVVERFARERQGALLDRASALIALITAGRYTKVVQPRGSEQLALQRAADATPLEPERLSTATREQLFLALRLAYVLDYCSKNEPLPVILDDVQVNFDAERARASFAALQQVSQSTQVLVFTCHDHLVALAREEVPGVEVVEGLLT